MGKKTPRKKLRGIKDPYKQQEARLNKVKDKINNKPNSTEVQEIPRRLQTIADFNTLKQKKSGSVVKKTKKKTKRLIDGRKFMGKEREQRGMTRPDKLVPVMKQNKNESKKKFLDRVNQMTNVTMKEEVFENKFKVDVRRDTSGKVLSVIPRELEAKLALDPNYKSRSQKRTQAKKERILQKKNKSKKEDDDEFAQYQDKVEFGEVVYEPPSLDTEKLTRKVNGGIVKPKTFLFMDQLKHEGSTSEGSSTVKASRKGSSVSVARQRIVEAEREKAVEAYRQAKAARAHAVSLPDFS